MRSARARLVSAVAGLIEGSLWGYAVMMLSTIVLGLLNVTPYPGVLFVPAGALFGLVLGLSEPPRPWRKKMRRLIVAVIAALVTTGVFALLLWLT